MFLSVHLAGDREAFSTTTDVDAILDKLIHPVLYNLLNS
jgi:hypothetical protein